MEPGLSNTATVHLYSDILFRAWLNKMEPGSSNTTTVHLKSNMFIQSLIEQDGAGFLEYFDSSFVQQYVYLELDRTRWSRVHRILRQYICTAICLFRAWLNKMEPGSSNTSTIHLYSNIFIKSLIEQDGAGFIEYYDSTFVQQYVYLELDWTRWRRVPGILRQCVCTRSLQQQSLC